MPLKLVSQTTHLCYDREIGGDASSTNKSIYGFLMTHSNPPFLKCIR